MKKSCAIIAAILSLCMLCACGAIQPSAADTPAPTQAPANTSESAAPSPEVTEAPEVTEKRPKLPRKSLPRPKLITTPPTPPS